MKTIEEALNIAYDECKSNAYFGNGFKKGVEFAQRWIPVEKKLPEVSEIVLVKTKINKVTTCEMYIPKDYLGNILGEKEWAASYNFKQAITHWRPVNLK